jgi:hypothetical protein
MDPGGKIYTTDQFRCWKVENLDDEVRPLNTWILFRFNFGPFVVNWGVNGTFESDFL